MNWLPSGNSFKSLPLNPDVTMILIGGHRPRTACASLIPSIDPGMLMSVNTILISPRLSRIRMASSAFDAQSASNPASRIMSIASIRMSGSSSTASTTGRREVSNASPFERRAPRGEYFGQSAASFNVGARLSIRPGTIIQSYSLPSASQLAALCAAGWRMWLKRLILRRVWLSKPTHAISIEPHPP